MGGEASEALQQLGVQISDAASSAKAALPAPVQQAIDTVSPLVNSAVHQVHSLPYLLMTVTRGCPQEAAIDVLLPCENPVPSLSFLTQPTNHMAQGIASEDDHPADQLLMHTRGRANATEAIVIYR